MPVKEIEALAQIEDELRSLSRSAADSCRYNERTAVSGKPLFVYLSEVADRIHEAASLQRAIIAELAVVVRTECDGEKHHVTLLADADRIVGGEQPKRPESVQTQGVISDNSAPGNNASLRAALIECVDMLSSFKDDPEVAESISIADDALAKPPRNCDRFTDGVQAYHAFAEETKSGMCDQAFFVTQWLFGTAKKGGAK